jgi:polyisoprenoid-binding protein YceI
VEHDVRRGARRPSEIFDAVRTNEAASAETSVPFLVRFVRGEPLLDAANYPQIRFVIRHFSSTGDAGGTLSGDPTIHGVTHPVDFDVTVKRPADATPQAEPQTLVFSAEGRFSRAKFGLTVWPSLIVDDLHVHIRATFALH